MIDNDTVQNLSAGAFGSGIAVWLAKATGVDLVVMFIGGCAAAHFLGAPTAEYFNLTKHASSVGFVVGFLSILVLRKAYETLQSLDAKSLAKAFTDSFPRLGGK